MRPELRAVPKVPCLGVGTYTIRVVRRRTAKQAPAIVGEEAASLSGDWGRTIDSTSSASVTLALNTGCCDLLSKMTVLIHELEIWRDTDMVWAGPVTDFSVDEEAKQATIAARDLSYWFNLRAFRHTMKPVDIDLALIFKGYCEYALGRSFPEWAVFFEGDPGPRPQPDGRVLPARPADPPLYVDDFGLRLDVTPVGIPGKRTVFHGELKVVMAELEELGQTGVDWTVHNRTMTVGGAEVLAADGLPVSLPGRMTDDDFVTPPRLRMTSDGQATEVLTRANGFRSRVGGPHPDTGIEVTRVLDEYSIEDQASADAAAQSYYARGRDPLLYVEGAGALSPNSAFQVQQLVPGARVRVAFSGAGCINYTGALRIESIGGSWDTEGERITPVLQPLGAAGADARGQGG